jgi:protein-tyrosine phosphatase
MTSKVYMIDGPWQGKLAILPRPRGGDWLADEIAAWKHAEIDVVVSALMTDEIDSFELAAESAEAQRQGLEFVSFPIPDRGVPETANAKAFESLLTWLNEGKHVGIHCRQGIGRSSLLAATLLILAGVRTEEAWQRLEAARGRAVPDTPEQKVWVERFTRSGLAEASQT